ncbi:MAG: lysoplasmalogenase [Deltaproteobacteria bacterium]|nr:lysoplasmalogenase [Deltaproteobacteria bacterium]
MGTVLTKTALSLTFVLAAWIQPCSLESYRAFILAGLLLCLGGDIFLALPRKKMFLLGLGSFLLGHACFFFGFFYVAEASRWTLIGVAVSLLLSIPVVIRLRPHLGSMKAPVLIYIAAIDVMIVGAWSVFGDAELSFAGRTMTLGGAFLLYFSDVFVARNRFIKKEFNNRLLGLPLYYIGQFLLAFSLGLLEKAL